MSFVRAKEFDPKRSQAGFYSPQLFKWLGKYPERIQVFQGTWNSTTGFEGEQPLYIGIKDGDFVHGAVLRSICAKNARLHAAAYGPAHGAPDWKDVSEQFWENYRHKGICAIHGDYAHDWDSDTEFAKCLRCGKPKKEALHARTVVS